MEESFYRFFDADASVIIKKVYATWAPNDGIFRHGDKFGDPGAYSLTGNVFLTADCLYPPPQSEGKP